MIFEIVFAFVGTALVVRVLSQRAEIRGLLRERKRLLAASKHAEDDIADSKRRLLLMESERDILEIETKRLKTKLEKSKDICERLWESNTELLTRIANSKSERELPTFEF